MVHAYEEKVGRQVQMIFTCLPTFSCISIPIDSLLTHTLFPTKAISNNGMYMLNSYVTFFNKDRRRVCGYLYTHSQLFLILRYMHSHTHSTLHTHTYFISYKAIPNNGMYALKTGDLCVDFCTSLPTFSSHFGMSFSAFPYSLLTHTHTHSLMPTNKVIPRNGVTHTCHTCSTYLNSYKRQENNS